jgi:mercuric reductase
MGKEQVELSISGMTCQHCAATISRQLENRQGVTASEVSYPEGKGKVTFDPDQISKEQVINTVNQSGQYQVTGEAPSSSQSTFDLIIIGGGSAAFSAAITANEQGLATLMVNAGLPTGGTCVNVGCVPSKFLIRAAESLHRAGNSPFAGISARKADLDLKQVVEQKNELVARMRHKKYLDLLQGLEYVKTIDGFAEFLDSQSILVDGETTYRGLKFLIATGASAFIPPIEGLENVSYLTSQTLFELEELPESLTVLGAGYVALEIAQAYSRFGSQVRILQRSEHILSHVTPDVSDALAEQLRQEGVKIYTQARVEKVEQNDRYVKVSAVVNGERITLESSHLLVAMGTKANTSSMGLEKLGIGLTPTGHIMVNPLLETPVANVYAAGDCTTNPAFVYTAAYQGKLAVQNAFMGTQLETDFSALPWVVFTDPQVAGAGLDERAAEAAGIPYQVSTLPLTEVPRSAVTQDTRGFVKLLRNPETDRLIGARVMAAEGGELVTQLSLAIKHNITVAELANSFYPYLTLSEGIKLAALTFTKDVSQLSCCAS